MALTANTMVDTARCLLVAWVDEAKQDGAISQVDATNRDATRPLIVWARYLGTVVKSPSIAPGGTYSRTFRGNPQAGDVTEIGYY